MTDPNPHRLSVHNDDELSFLSLGTTLLRNRWRIMRWMLLGASIAALSVISRPAMYPASASFVPQGNDAARTGLASLAGQFGVAMPTSTQSFTSDFYAKLLNTRVLLRRVARDTFVVREMGERRIPFLDLFDVPLGVPARREEQGAELLMGMVTTSVTRSTGVVDLSVETQWPSVSLAIVSSLIDEVNEFNRRTKQGQAAAERIFVEGRLVLADDSLRVAEDRLERFLQTNRQFTGSPELIFERERLQRDLTMRQQVSTSLMQSLEEARIREVRDTPVITVIEPPSVRSVPRPRGRVRSTLLGFVLGGFIGVLVVFASAWMARRRQEQDGEADEFVSTLGEIRREILRPVRWLRERIRSR